MSARICRIQTTFEAQAESAMYSASVDDSAMRSWFLATLLMQDDPRNSVYPVTEVRLSGSFAQSASA